MTIYSGVGELNKLGDIVKSYNAHRVLVVTGSNSFQACGAKEIINNCLKDYQVTYFSDFEVNPRLVDAKRGVELATGNSIELIISVGGGSVLDMAKLIKALYSNPDEALNLAKGIAKVSDPHIPLIAVPTTAGSGSESTHFAVVYVEDMKYSLADSCLLPNDIILDGNLTLSATRYQKACNVLDALSQSIESAWAVGSTAESLVFSFEALDLCVKNFSGYVNSTGNPIVAQAMIKASNLAGQAINITKTTAAHAWSYSLTKKYGVPHGHAVWVTLPQIFEIHSTSHADLVSDPRGPEHLMAVMEKLKDILSISTEDNIGTHFEYMLASIGVKANIEIDFGISERARSELSRNVNQERLQNNPVTFTPSSIKKIFKLS
jgi:alcohol dehydrogenase class IV